MSDPQLDRWNQRFTDAEGYLFGTTPSAFLESQRGALPASGRALAIADGEGRNGVWLAQQGLSVVSMDFSPVGQEKARRLAAEAGVEIETVQADIFNWAWPDADFDVM